MSKHGYSRSDFYVNSKIPPAYQTYERAVSIIKASEQAVDLGYLDCMLLLWPGSFRGGKIGLADDPANVENRHETWKALEVAQAQPQTRAHFWNTKGYRALC